MELVGLQTGQGPPHGEGRQRRAQSCRCGTNPTSCKGSAEREFIPKNRDLGLRQQLEVHAVSDTNGLAVDVDGLRLKRLLRCKGMRDSVTRLFDIKNRF